jgi:catechol 2,3-dioxygenase-like lactoylglutathione lyase family enzyme
MKFVNPLPFVADIDNSKRFYADILGLRIVEDHGNFVRFEGGFALHDGRTLHQTVFGEESDDHTPYGRQNLVLYFEVDNIDLAFARIGGQVGLIHCVKTQSWGQRVFRLHDPDRHIVEIGESQSRQE